MNKRTRVTCIQCPNCCEIIYSRAHHDYSVCSCGRVFIDGGFEYVRCGYDPSFKKPKLFHKYVKATRKELYDDWNKSEDKYGRIKQ